VATATRQPSFGCFGMHEWAMVYQQTHVAYIAAQRAFTERARPLRQRLVDAIDRARLSVVARDANDTVGSCATAGSCAHR
jgi:hypothetical protein